MSELDEGSNHPARDTFRGTFVEESNNCLLDRIWLNIIIFNLTCDKQALV